MQGQCFGLLRRRAYQKKADQREYIKVIQANFRKYIQLRNWGWFILLQKTKPLIGQVSVYVAEAARSALSGKCLCLAVEAPCPGLHAIILHKMVCDMCSTL